MVYLGIMTAFMQSEEISPTAVYLLMILYVFHVILMKFNYSYEVWLKKSVASLMEVNELKRLANKNITHFHFNLDTRSPSIEILNRINFRKEGDILIFENM